MKYEEEKHPLFNQEALDQYVGVPSAYGKFVSIRITNSRNINV